MNQKFQLYESNFGFPCVAAAGAGVAGVASAAGGLGTTCCFGAGSGEDGGGVRHSGGGVASSSRLKGLRLGSGVPASSVCARAVLPHATKKTMAMARVRYFIRS